MYTLRITDPRGKWKHGRKNAMGYDELWPCGWFRYCRARVKCQNGWDGATCIDEVGPIGTFTVWKTRPNATRTEGE
jgi:hypothetical protein